MPTFIFSGKTTRKIVLSFSIREENYTIDVFCFLWFAEDGISMNTAAIYI